MHAIGVGIEKFLYLNTILIQRSSEINASKERVQRSQ